jgi:homoserine O-acetyltransferase
VAGGSLGGMQALEWAVPYPDQVDAVVAHRQHRTRCTRRAWPGTRSPASHHARPRVAGGHYYGTGGTRRRHGSWRGWSGTSPTCPRTR